MSPEQVQRMIEMLPTASTLLEIARVLEVSRHDLNYHARPYLLLMRVVGTLPDCVCGRARYHRGLCSPLIERLSCRTPEQQETHRLVVNMLADGMTCHEIQTIFNRPKDWAKDYERYLTPEQLATRRLRTRERASKLSDHVVIAVGMLIAGKRHIDVARATGMSVSASTRCLRRLTPEQRAARMRIVESRIAPRRDRTTGRMLSEEVAA